MLNLVEVGRALFWFFDLMGRTLGRVSYTAAPT